MAMAPNENDFGRKLCEVLGLPKTTKSFDLHVGIDEVVSVKALVLCEVDFAKFEEVFIEYDVCKKITTLKSNAQEFRAIK